MRSHRRLDLENGVVVVEFDKVDDVGGIERDGEFFCHILVGIDDLIRARAGQKLALDLRGGLGDDLFRPEIL